jgi:amicyanin
VVLIAGCSSPPPAPRPTVTFNADASTTPGMPGMGQMPSGSTGPVSQAPDGPGAPVSGTAVAIENFAFNPPSLSVRPGTTVTWTNRDEEPHTIVANDGSFRSPGLDGNGTYSYTFRSAGAFDYVCSIHPFMHGTVVVTP